MADTFIDFIVLWILVGYCHGFVIAAILWRFGLFGSVVGWPIALWIAQRVAEVIDADHHIGAV